MSTKITEKQIEIAKKENISNRRRFKILKKRITKQVRVSLSVHYRIRKLARENGITLSKFTDKILLRYISDKDIGKNTEKGISPD